MSFLTNLTNWLPHRGGFDSAGLPDYGPMPELTGLTGWLNSPPLTKRDLQGKAVLIDFWTYSCINCLRTTPFLKAWHKAYAGDRFIIIGVHTPEFEFEKNAVNVEKAVRRLGIEYPVAFDDDYKLWHAFKCRAWPGHYFVDWRGHIRYRHFGEGGYEASERVIRTLVTEADQPISRPPVSDSINERTDFSRIGTPETYLGFARQEYLGSPEGVRPNRPQRFTSVTDPALNVFYLEGLWEVSDEYIVPSEPGAKLIFRYRAPRVHLVADGADDGSRCDIRLDGEPLGEHERGTDIVNDAGFSHVSLHEGRLYNLVDDRRGNDDRILQITFLDPGVKLYSFTFG